MDLTFQKRLAASIFKCGKDKVYFDPKAMSDIEEAITRADIKMLIKKGVIKKLQVKGASKSRIRYAQQQKKKNLRKGQGSRKGTFNSRFPRKRRWIKSIRALRKTLKQLRTEGTIDKHTYHKFYRHAKGGMFKDKAHLRQHITSAAKGSVEK